MKSISLFLLLIATLSAWSSELVNIIKVPDSTYSERNVVSKKLAKLLGIEQPLPFSEALAEICYGVDICAQITSDSDVNNECNPEDYDDEYKPEFGSACYLKNFREQYRCSSEFSSMTMKGVEAFSKILVDTNRYYTNLVSNNFIEYYKAKFKVDLSIQSNIEQFKKAHPKEMEKVQNIMSKSLALGSYTGNCYSKLNKFLYSQKKEKITRYYNLYSAILDTLEYFPDFKKKVNRGVSLPSSVLKEHHKIGNIVCYDAFTSTSIHSEKDYTSKPRNYFLKDKCSQRLYISYVDNGARPGKLIKSASMSPGEEEVLFAPGSCFRIDNVSPRTDEVDPDDNDYDCQEGERFNFELTLVPSNS